MNLLLGREAASRLDSAKEEIPPYLLGPCFVAEGLIERSDPRMKLFV
jgi:hypothetical protein